MGLGDYLREGAVDLFGLRPEIEEAREMHEVLNEAGLDARLLSRKVEDLEQILLSGVAGTNRELAPEKRREIVDRAYLYFQEDPLLRQAVNLVTWYTFGRGLPKPKYRDEEEQATKLGQEYIDRFWFDEDNQEALTRPQAQEMKSTELQVQGNIFLLLFPSDERAQTPRVDDPATLHRADLLDLSYRPPEATANAKGGGTPPQAEPLRGSATLKVTDVPEPEIVQVISHPENRKIPVYYQRDYTTRVYDFESKTYKDGEKKTAYYRDWKHSAPTEVNGQPWGPKPEEIADGLVYHVKVNCVSDSKFGQSELRASLDWARGIKVYMTNRLNVIQAISAIAMRAKARGGPRQVSQVAGNLADITGLANAIEGATSTTRERAAEGATKVSVENAGADLQPMVTDTGSSAAATDLQTMLAQVAASTGIPPHYFGSPGSASLATATAMELPVLKMMEARQELWEGVFRDILGYMLQNAGLDPEKIDVSLPSILARDAGQIAATLSQAAAVIGIGDVNIIRFIFTEILDALGKVNAEEIANRLFPEDWQPPLPPELAQGAAPPLDTENRAADIAARNGADRAPSQRGGTEASRRAAQARQDRASGRVGQRQSYEEAGLLEFDFEESEQEGGLTHQPMRREMGVDAPDFGPVLGEAAATYDSDEFAGLPEEVRYEAAAALGAMDGLRDDLLAEIDGDDD